MQVTGYSDDIIQAQRTDVGIVHRSLMISIGICTQFCAVNVLLINEQNLDHFFKQLACEY